MPQGPIAHPESLPSHWYCNRITNLPTPPLPRQSIGRSPPLTQTATVPYPSFSWVVLSIYLSGRSYFRWEVDSRLVKKWSWWVLCLRVTCPFVFNTLTVLSVYHVTCYNQLHWDAAFSRFLSYACTRPNPSPRWYPPPSSFLFSLSTTSPIICHKSGGLTNGALFLIGSSLENEMVTTMDVSRSGSGWRCE